MTRRRLLEISIWTVLGVAFASILLWPLWLIINTADFSMTGARIIIACGLIVGTIVLLEQTSLFYIGDGLIVGIMSSEAIMALVLFINTRGEIDPTPLSAVSVLLFLLSIIFGFVTLSFRSGLKELRIRRWFAVTTFAYCIYALLLAVGLWLTRIELA